MIKKSEFNKSNDIVFRDIVRGPKAVATRYNKYCANEFLFVIKDYEANKVNQNNGVKVTQGVKLDKEANLRLVRLSNFINSNQIGDEPFILAEHARQVFYSKDPKYLDWSVVLDVPAKVYVEDEICLTTEQSNMTDIDIGQQSNEALYEIELLYPEELNVVVERRDGPNAWSVMYLSIPAKLKGLYNNGYKMVIFTNGSNIDRFKYNERQTAIDSKIGRLNNFTYNKAVDPDALAAIGCLRAISTLLEFVNQLLHLFLDIERPSLRIMRQMLTTDEQGVDNLIPMELALKIVDKIRTNERFAVYAVVPMGSRMFQVLPLYKKFSFGRENEGKSYVKILRHLFLLHNAHNAFIAAWT
ncbi:hypothetical protein GIB67_034904 [Kingdonia uniflora]|uniref:DUF4216 domain-containing protein n=1 Tax=Kingdonia uniflora TaxID=39325 RepID=A0A7J7NH10_9MAGN|nr:hypothetical protein GIB67_034904 [Kingdonia uniflora]